MVFLVFGLRNIIFGVVRRQVQERKVAKLLEILSEDGRDKKRKKFLSPVAQVIKGKIVSVG